MVFTVFFRRNRYLTMNSATTNILMMNTFTMNILTMNNVAINIFAIKNVLQCSEYVADFHGATSAIEHVENKARDDFPVYGSLSWFHVNIRAHGGNKAAPNYQFVHFQGATLAFEHMWKIK